ncbi:MAG: DUF1800 family protein [Vicinamibacteria bacterium]|jgi:uncharacterized protein (DUF1800 family)
MTRLSSTLAVSLLAATLAHAGPPIGEDGARHLLARTGFGPTAAEIARYAPLDRESAVARVLASSRSIPVTVPPAALTDDAPIGAPPDGATNEERRAYIREQVRLGLEMRGWWMREMLATESPLAERMTLFWHNHFVSSQQKVRSAKLMYRQNATLRRYALGDFGALLHAASKDAAMLLYLDGVRNRRGAPNENFAREVMELFTLGEGHYNERDVKEAARAFSGWSLERGTGTFVFRRALHDPGEKTILGRTGRFDGDAVLDILLERPETAELIVAKLWREFVSPDPDEANVRRIAADFRRSGYRTPVALSKLLNSDAFWSQDNRGVLVKSPIELVVGTLRSLEVAPDDAVPFALAAAGMGQNLFSPPNVKGWRGGEAWIDSSTLLARKQFVESISRYEESRTMRAMTASPALPASRALLTPAPPIGTDANADEDARARQLRIARALDRAFRELAFSATRFIASMPGDTPAAKRRNAQTVLLPIAPAGSGASIPQDADALAFVRLTMLDPVYQLK